MSLNGSAAFNAINRAHANNYGITKLN